MSETAAAVTAEDYNGKGSEFSERDLRIHCLNVAHNPNVDSSEVVKRAEAYLKFTKGENHD